jgi:hypothetical protein
MQSDLGQHRNRPLVQVRVMHASVAANQVPEPDSVHGKPKPKPNLALLRTFGRISLQWHASVLYPLRLLSTSSVLPVGEQHTASAHLNLSSGRARMHLSCYQHYAHTARAALALGSQMNTGTVNSRPQMPTAALEAVYNHSCQRIHSKQGPTAEGYVA